jgi:hypothetical protein
MRRPRRKRPLLGILAGVAAEALAMRLRGYPMGGTDVVVRCRAGHLFSTIWFPGISVKSIRLLWWRVQRCPVGGHWTIVTPVGRGELGETQLRSARERRDVRLP